MKASPFVSHINQGFSRSLTPQYTLASEGSYISFTLDGTSMTLPWRLSVPGSLELCVTSLSLLSSAIQGDNHVYTSVAVVKIKGENQCKTAFKVIQVEI